MLPQLSDGERRRRIATRAARELQPGWVVNLGVGLPLLVAGILPPDGPVFLHTENGMIGFRALADGEVADDDLVDAGKQPIAPRPGCAYFNSSDSFAMVRGGHLDAAVLGILQVDREGWIANWTLPGKPILGVGGAMDLVSGARRVIMTTTLLASDGRPKLVERCTLPVTGRIREGLVVTEAAVFHLDRERGFSLVERAEGVTVDDLRAAVGCDFRLPD